MIIFVYIEYASVSVYLTSMPTLSSALFQFCTCAAGFQLPPDTAGFQQPPGAAGFQQPPGAAGFQQPPGAAGFQQPPDAAGFQLPPGNNNLVSGILSDISSGGGGQSSSIPTFQPIVLICRRGNLIFYY